MTQGATDSAPVGAAGTTRSRSHVTVARGRKAVLGLGWSALNSGSAVLISILVFVVSSRLLGPEDFGIVALAMSIITFVGCVTPGGFGEAIVQRAEIDDAHLDSVFWLCLGSGLVLFVPILLFALPLAAWLKEPALTLLLPFFGVKLLFDLAAVVPQALVVRAMQFKHVAARTAIGNSIGGLVCIGMALKGYGLWALAMAPMVTSVVSLVILFHSARWRPGFRIRLASLRDMMRFGLFASGASALHFLNLDRLVLGFIVGPVTLGLYFLGRRLYDILSGLFSGAIWPVATVFFASVQNERDTHAKAFRNVLRTSALVAFPLFAGLYMVAESAVPMVLGAHWAPALPAVQAFALIGLLGGLLLPSSALANGLGRSDLNFSIDVLRNLLSVAAILVAVQGGLDRIMDSLVIAHTLLLPAGYAVARRLIGIGPLAYLEALLVPALATLAMLAAIAFLPLLLPALQGWALLLAQIGIGGAVYALLAFGLSQREIADLRRAFAEEPAHG